MRSRFTFVVLVFSLPFLSFRNSSAEASGTHLAPKTPLFTQGSLSMYIASLQKQRLPQPLASAQPPSSSLPSLQAQGNSLAKRNRFSIQGGFALSLVPVRYLWSSNGEVHLVQTGFLGHAFLRPHPRLTLDLGLGITPSIFTKALPSLVIAPNSTAPSSFVFELPLTIGCKVHLEPISKEKPSSLSPYLSVDAGVTFSQLFNSIQEVVDKATYFEARFGPGLEFRFHPKFSLFLEGKGIFQARMNPEEKTFVQGADQTPVFSLGNLRAGLWVSFGLLSYF